MAKKRRPKEASPALPGKKTPETQTPGPKRHFRGALLALFGFLAGAGLLALFMEYGLFVPWKERREATQLNAVIGREIFHNVEQLGRKLEEIEKGPSVGTEPRDDYEKALQRAQRARSLRFETGTYQGNVSNLHRLDSRVGIEEFYSRLDKAVTLESQVVAVMKTEKAFSDAGIVRPYPWHRLAALENYYVLLLLYGSEILSGNIGKKPPKTLRPLTKVDLQKEEIETTARKTNTSSLQIIGVRLADWDEYITRGEAPAGRLKERVGE